MIRPEDEVQFTFGGIIFRKDVAGGTMSTEVTFAPYGLPDGVTCVVRHTPEDGKPEEVRRFSARGAGRDAMASIHSAVIASTVSKSSLQAVMEDENGEPAELRVFVTADGISMVPAGSYSVVARLSFPTKAGLGPEEFETETWGIAEVAANAAGVYEAANVRTFQDAEEFFAASGIGIRIGTPVLPAAVRAIIPAR